MSSFCLTILDYRIKNRPLGRAGGSGWGFRRLWRQLVKDLHKLLERLRADDRLPVDDKRRGTLHADLLGSGGFLLDDLGIFTAIEAFVKGSRIQPHFGSKGFQVVLVESALVFSILALEEQVVVFPELILVGGAFAGLCGPRGLIS